MTFEEALRKIVKAYFNDLGPDALIKASKKSKYTKKYFDKVATDSGIEVYNLKKKEGK